MSATGGDEYFDELRDQIRDVREDWDSLAVVEDGRRVYRASGLGGCVSALVAGALQYEGKMPASLDNALREGVESEPIILSMLADRGWKYATYPMLAALKHAGRIAGYNAELGQIQTRLNVGKTAVIRAHPDQIGVFEEGIGPHKPFHVVEVKKFKDDFWKKWKAEGLGGLPGYARQLSAQMHGAKLPGVFCVGHYVDGEVVEIDWQVYETAPVGLFELKKLVLDAEKFAATGDVPECREGRWPCLYADMPWHIEPDKADIKQIDDIKLKIALTEYAAARDAEKIAKDAKAAAGVAIRNTLMEHRVANNEKIASGGYEVTWVESTMKEHLVKESTRSFPQVKRIK